MGMSVLQAMPAMAPGRAGPGAKGLQNGHSWFSRALWTIATDWCTQVSRVPAGQMGSSRYISPKHRAELDVSCVSVPDPKTATLLHGQGRMSCSHPNGAPSVAPTPWHHEHLHSDFSSPRYLLISSFPRKKDFAFC